MAQDLVVWCGPISSELSKVQWAEPTHVLVIPMGIGSEYDCTGSMREWSVEQHVDCHGSQAFGRLFQSLALPPPPETKNDELLRRYGLEPNVWRTRSLASFSAGHGLVEPLLLHSPTDWECVCLADSYYTGAPAVKPGIAAFAQRAVEGRALFIATCSASGNANTRPCNECIMALVERLELVAFDMNGRWPGPVQPERVWARGKAIVADFGARATHGEHATKLLAPLMQAWVSPTLASAAITFPPEQPRHRILAQSPAPWAPQLPSPKPASSWYAWAIGVACTAGLIGAGYLALRSGKAKRGNAPSLSENGDDPPFILEAKRKAARQGDYWIAPDGGLLTVRDGWTGRGPVGKNDVHQAVAEEQLLSGATGLTYDEAERQILAVGATEAYMQAGAVRIMSGHDLTVFALNTRTLRLVQQYLHDLGYPAEDKVLVEEDKGNGRYVEVEVSYLLAARSPSQVWRGPYPVMVREMTYEGPVKWAPLRGDFWILSSGERISANQASHADVARCFLEKQGVKTATSWEASDMFFADGAIRVSGAAFELERWNDDTMKRVQAHISSQLGVPSGLVMIERRTGSTRRPPGAWQDRMYITPQASDVLDATSASKLWRESESVTELDEGCPRRADDGLVVEEGRRNFVFVTDCVGWGNGEDIYEMKLTGEAITRRQFLAQVDPDGMRQKEAELGYEREARRGLTMAHDWHVGYYRGKFLGVPAAYFVWSGIEHIFVDPDAWNAMRDVRRPSA